VKCWGNNDAGQLGDGTKNNSNVPVDVRGLSAAVQGIALGPNHSCALLSGGDIECWGSNSEGQLGNGKGIESAYPVKVDRLPGIATAIAAGSAHTCAILENGAVTCWGDNYSGALGDGTTVDRFYPQEVVGLPDKAKALAVGVSHTCALLVNGEAMCWGDNRYSQLGDGTIKRSNSPVKVIGLSTGIVAVASGQYHNCALNSNGDLQCWGYIHHG
jgi:alpha-tubulin suppressor-like RCC1 family protein